MIRTATSKDFDAILRLNDEWVHVTSPLDRAALARLNDQAAYHRVVESDGEVVAFLLALREGADYASPNYRWFAASTDTFLYIDRVVVAGDRQGEGLGAALYDDLFAFAAATGNGYVVCEIDAEPPNVASDAFHTRYGFAEVGTQWIAGGTKRVSLRRARVIAPADPEEVCGNLTTGGTDERLGA